MTTLTIYPLFLTVLVLELLEFHFTIQLHLELLKRCKFWIHCKLSWL